MIQLVLDIELGLDDGVQELLYKLSDLEVNHKPIDLELPIEIAKLLIVLVHHFLIELIEALCSR